MCNYQMIFQLHVIMGKCNRLILSLGLVDVRRTPLSTLVSSCSAALNAPVIEAISNARRHFYFSNQPYIRSIDITKFGYIYDSIRSFRSLQFHFDACAIYLPSICVISALHSAPNVTTTRCQGHVCVRPL